MFSERKNCLNDVDFIFERNSNESTIKEKTYGKPIIKQKPPNPMGLSKEASIIEAMIYTANTITGKAYKDTGKTEPMRKFFFRNIKICLFFRSQETPHQIYRFPQLFLGKSNIMSVLGVMNNMPNVFCKTFLFNPYRSVRI